MKNLSVKKLTEILNAFDDNQRVEFSTFLGKQCLLIYNDYDNARIDAIVFTCKDIPDKISIKKQTLLKDCSSINYYGYQNEEFFAFSNGIIHKKDGSLVFEKSSEHGVVVHKKHNYYVANLSTLNEYDQLASCFILRNHELDECITFEKWAILMDNVYVNDNGKWAILFAIMCAFRSDIYLVNKFFTSLFFYGPINSHKSSITNSISSLFISPNENTLNLNICSDARFAKMIEILRDIPIVLEEYNNQYVSDFKLTALKSIVFDGSILSKKRSEPNRINAPVIISGQELPIYKAGENTLISRLIIREMPKDPNLIDSRLSQFLELKKYENPDKAGLFNVFVEILNIRPIIVENFEELYKECSKDLKENCKECSELDCIRIIHITSLFLATCKIIEDRTDLKLPFTYKEFLLSAIKQVEYQSSLLG